MSRFFPFRPPLDLNDNRAPRLVDIDDKAADDVFLALSSTTARKILAALHEEPQTTSDLAETVGTSVQNASYHLEKLQDTDLIEVVDTWYSERGTEMNVYAPQDESLVVFAGSNKRRTFRKLLARFVGAIGMIGVLWIIIDTASSWFTGNLGSKEGDPIGGVTETTVGTANGTTTIHTNGTGTATNSTTGTITNVTTNPVPTPTSLSTVPPSPSQLTASANLDLVIPLAMLLVITLLLCRTTN